MAIDNNRVIKPVKRLRKLVNKLNSQPSSETVHDLRTTTRRFETIVEALSLDGQGVRKSMLKNLRRFRKRAGKVRDMDVLTSHASTVHLQGEEDCVVQLLEYLGARRRKHAKRLYAEVREARPILRKELKRTPAILAKRIRKNGDVPEESEAAANATAIAMKLAAQLASPPRLDRETLHPYRLKIKELRDVLLMAAGIDGDKFVDDLGKLKDAIGEWHDWEELVCIAQKVLNHGNKCGLLDELKRIANRKYEHALALAQTLRTRYLRAARPQKKGSSAASPKIPSEPVLKAIAMLAG